MTGTNIGRFAPSPSGPLHLGSLVTALGSYLQVKQTGGLWRLRIDDIDPPRTVEGASEQIQSCLLAHGLEWDGNVLFQSQQYTQYERALDTLAAARRLYPCNCSRQTIKAAGPFYTGTCRNKAKVDPPYSLRLKNPQQIDSLLDVRLGKVEVDQQATGEDFIVRRRDGLIAYHLASVIDDIQMGVTEIVRGMDLLLPTACQLALFLAFDANIPSFIHLPVVSFADGRKYSKQNHAPPIDPAKAKSNLYDALTFLGQQPPTELKHYRLEHILDWGIANWSLKRVGNNRI